MTGEIPENELGPAMRALNERQRLFVLAMASNPFGTATGWARRAGYSDTGGGIRVLAHRLVHDPKIQAAAAEVGQAVLGTMGPLLAANVLIRTARDRKHPKQLRAAELIANRVGMHEKSEHVLKVHHTDATGEAIEKRMLELGQRLGVDVARLLGPNTAPVIEGEFSEVKRGE